MGTGRSRFEYTPVHNANGTYRIYNPPVTINRKISEFPFLFHYAQSRLIRRMFVTFAFISVPILAIVAPTMEKEELRKKRESNNYTRHEPPRPYMPPEVEPYRPQTGFKHIFLWSPPKYRMED